MDYELLDFGNGRKLERFGQVILDRPSPAAERQRAVHPMEWSQAFSKYDRTGGEQGVWRGSDLPESWEIGFSLEAGSWQHSLHFQLKPSPFGHVGVFAEQADNWQWLAKTVRRTAPLKVLNLFAYTGGSTLAAAAAGAEVVHVDAADNIVQRAKLNAELSGLSGLPIRWIAEDALKFCRREVKRGNSYDAVILDPPTYGHGPRGEKWKIATDLVDLLGLCGELTNHQPAFILATCHSPGIGPAELSAYVSDGFFGHCGQPPKSGQLYLKTVDGRKLPSGVFARWPG